MPEFDSTFADEIATEVIAERSKQFDKWGDQPHDFVGRDITRSDAWRIKYEREADRYKSINDSRAVVNDLTWDGILLEEVFEAFAENDTAKIRDELVQVAAVAFAAIECIDRTPAPAEASEAVSAAEVAA